MDKFVRRVNKNSQTKPGSQVLSQTQTQPISTTQQNEKKPKLPKGDKEDKESTQNTKKFSKGLDIVVTKTKVDSSSKKLSLPKSGKPHEEKSSNHYNPFTHDTTATNKGSKIYADKDIFDPHDKCNPLGEGEFRNKNFVVTGVMEEMDRDELKRYIHMFGGVCGTSISGKTAVLVAGNDSGPAKMKQAADRGIKVWKEDDVFDYVKKALKLTDDDIIAEYKKHPEYANKFKANTDSLNIVDTIEIKEEIKKVEEKKLQETIWTEKYRPSTVDDLIGNNSQVTKIFEWMKKWETMIPNRRCLLLAGPPGVGKTTISKIVGRSLGYNLIEFNASDVRNKSSIEKNLKSILFNGQLNFNTMDKTKPQFQINKQGLIIMDEVDGMSSGDRGGIAELVKFIKEIEQPIICICNDLNNKKMQSLISQSETIIFQKISMMDIRNRLLYICKQENVAIDDNSMDQILGKSHGDVRYAINMLQTYVKNGVMLSEKNEDVDYIDIIPSLITKYNETTFFEKNNIFFMDSFMMPIYLHDSLYRSQKFSLLSKAFSSFAYGDIFQSIVNKTQNWKLMPICGTFKVSISTYYGQTQNPGTKIVFPKILGKISKRKGNQTRLLMMTHNNPNKLMKSRDYSAVPMMYIRNTIIKVMKKDPIQAAQLALKFGLKKESWDEMIKVGEMMEIKKLYMEVPTGNKTKFSKALNAANAEMKTSRSTRGRGKTVADDDSDEEDSFEPADMSNDDEEVFEEDDYNGDNDYF